MALRTSVAWPPATRDFLPFTLETPVRHFFPMTLGSYCIWLPFEVQGGGAGGGVGGGVLRKEVG